MAFGFIINSTANGVNVTVKENVVHMGRAFFNDTTREKISIVNISDSVETIGRYTFSGCSSLTAITVDTNNPSYSSVDSVLFNKEKTELIYCPRGKTGAYSVPAGVTSIGSYAFYNCTSLTSVTIPDSVTSIGEGAVAYCTSLTSVTIPNGVTRIGSYAFEDCTSLTNVIIPDSVTSIENDAFRSCTSLTHVSIPDSVISIGMYAFNGCTSLRGVTITGSVTTIGDYAFNGCTKLARVTIPDGLISIREGAFYKCPLLKNIYYNGTHEKWAQINKYYAYDYEKDSWGLEPHFKEGEYNLIIK